ncbi:MAG: signal peptidase I [Bacilli bacterium]|nr:signal peptidase I [Bacilli bacterium]
MDKNKKEQTFKDLFSNLEQEDNKESFNNLFAETKSTDTSENKLFNDILKETPSLIEESEQVKEEKNDINLNNLVSENNKLEEEKHNEVVPEKEDESINTNIFFEDNNTPSETVEKNEETSKIELDNIFKEEKKEEPQINPFLEEISSEEPIIEEEKDPLDENPFFVDNEENLEVMEKQLVDDKINLVENKKHEAIENDNNKIDTTNVKHFNVKIVKKKDPPIKFILGVLSYALFIWLLLIGIALLVYVADIKIRAAKGDTSSPTFNAYVVLTGSMLPEIQVYDVVVTKKIEVKDLKEGDIITFASSDTRFLNTIITHRILKKYYDSEKKQYTFQTKGDNNNVADSALVQENNIFGKVILKIPKLGYLQEFLASRGGWIVVILLPCLAVISYDIVKLMKSLKRKKYKNIKVQK